VEEQVVYPTISSQDERQKPGVIGRIGPLELGQQVAGIAERGCASGAALRAKGAFVDGEALEAHHGL
jgi:hypothetical protein